eukprot:TRINITY_DN4480_c0_g1_i1.p3 TRINITY_DN4480_c0_g1~~TRINITY_DN4480_c0_g1_i1.p3  ORF type:complete len:196 (+),score=-2.52 TRINITY_DN4480_c0_g1_i1:335-922(+)
MVKTYGFLLLQARQIRQQQQLHSSKNKISYCLNIKYKTNTERKLQPKKTQKKTLESVENPQNADTRKKNLEEKLLKLTQIRLFKNKLGSIHKNPIQQTTQHFSLYCVFIYATKKNKKLNGNQVINQVQITIQRKRKKKKQKYKFYFHYKQKVMGIESITSLKYIRVKGSIGFTIKQHMKLYLQNDIIFRLKETTV